MSLPTGSTGTAAREEALSSLRRLRGRAGARARTGLLDEAVATLTDLGFEVTRWPSPDDLRARLLEIIPAGATAAYHRCVLGQAIAIESTLREAGRHLAALPAGANASLPAEDWRARLLAAEFGITGANAIIADTGTLVLFEDSGFGRAASNIPPVHIALVTADSVVENLLDAAIMARAYAALHPAEPGPSPPALPRYISLISGPSKTADIGHTLVRGMHGPRTVHVLICEQPKAPGADDDALADWVLA